MDGLLPLWKEKGMTSHDVVFKLRKILHTKKIGHAGTLDPDVDGVLPVAIGKGTKVLEFMVDSDKRYIGEVTLGIATTTEDASGDVVEQEAIAPNALDEAVIDQALATFIGQIQQVPPMYSAVTVNGKRLYEYARAGIEVERPVRQAMIHSFKRTSPVTYENQVARFSFEVHCGKGTYVRTLAVNLGEQLGYPSHMSQLTRTLSAGFQAEAAVTLAEVAELQAASQLDQVIQPLETGLSHLETMHLTDQQWSQVQHGAVFRQADWPVQSYPVVCYYRDQAVAIYEEHPSKAGLVKPKKVLRTEV